ncbi:MAG: UDP-glucose 4-epimerase GalE [Acidobacteriota bacterium]
MNILVTGGAGYIGSVVAERLLETGNQPVVYDNLSEGHRDAVPPGASLVVGDLADASSLTDCLQTHRVEAVIHLAASALVGESMVNPSKYIRNNILAGTDLLDAMLSCGVNRIVFSSSCAVYGEPGTLPITEDSPTGPTNPYGETKLAFERILYWYGVAHGLRYASLRYFNAAGATAGLGEDHSPETHLIPNVLSCALGLVPHVEVFGDDYPTPDGTCIRDYVHVTDLADAHLLALGALEKGSSLYNLGSGSGYSVLEVLDAARAVTGRPIRAQVTPRRPGDPAVLVASPERIKRELGWKPAHTDINSIVEDAWAWRLAHPNGYEQ